jgi:hypothetical protein
MSKVQKAPKYGEPLVLAAGCIGLFFGGFFLYIFVENYQKFLLSIYWAGAFGAFLDTFFSVFHMFKSEKNRLSVFHKWFLNHQSFLAVCLLAGVLSFFQFVFWDSGQMNSSLLGSPDYLNWGKMADFWINSTDPASWRFPEPPNWRPMTHSLVMFKDLLGTKMLFAAYAAALGQSASMTVSGFMLTLLLWLALPIHSLVRKIFGLGFWTSLLVAIGTIGGLLFHFSVYKGQFGELVTALGYLAAINELYSQSRSWFNFRTVAKLFTCVFLVFMACQDSFLVFSFFLAVSGVIYHFFLTKKPLLARVKKSLYAGITPVFLSTILSAAVMPSIAFIIVYKILEPVRQMVSWNISLINPWLMTGLPFYKFRYFTSLSQPSLLGYCLFFCFLFFLLFYLNKYNNLLAIKYIINKRTYCYCNFNINIRYIISIIITFSVINLMYLFVYYFYDNKYQAWIFISCIGFPLSFVILSLIIIIFNFMMRMRKP